MLRQFNSFLKGEGFKGVLPKATANCRASIWNDQKTMGLSLHLNENYGKVEAEMSLIFTCYNLRRSVTIFGVEDLIKRLKRASLEIVWLTALEKPDSSLFSVSLSNSLQQVNVF